MSNIGEIIKRYRDLRQYSQEYMAHKLNITQSSYAKL
jgi:transcriptional regulator with XRE-family HTH domain